MIKVGDRVKYSEDYHENHRKGRYKVPPREARGTVMSGPLENGTWGIKFDHARDRVYLGSRWLTPCNNEKPRMDSKHPIIAPVDFGQNRMTARQYLADVLRGMRKNDDWRRARTLYADLKRQLWPVRLRPNGEWS